MTSRFSPTTFAIIFSCIYAAAYFFNLPMFLYYPLHGDLTWGPAVMKNAGPGMVWYGLLADSFLGATVLALVVPESLVDRIFRNFVWVFPCAAMLVCVYMLRNFFLHG